MFKSFFGASAVLTAGLFFAVGVQVVQGQDVSEADIRALPGYKSYSTLGSFTKRLREDPALFNALQGNKALAERIFSSTMAQRQVLSKIKSSGDVQQALSGFEGDSSSNSSNSFGSSFGSQSVDRQEKIRATTKKTDTRQRRRSSVSSGGNNLAAQRAIVKAQREREAANRRAGDIMAKAREILDREQSAEALALQQKEIIASNKAVAAVMAELSDQPEALQAFLSDGALVQKVMDKEVTLSQALAEVDADINDDTASAGDTAVTENDSSFEDDSLFNDDFDGDPPSSEPEQGLVHVSGNHYKLNGMDVWDMNHIPEPSEQQLDANGWPKYLNVPAECPPPRENTEYIHSAYINYDGGGDPNHPFFGHGKGSWGDMSRRVNSYFHMTSLWYHTSLRLGNSSEGIKSQEISYPFIVPNRTGKRFHASGFEAPGGTVQSMSYCPGDFTGVTPAGKTPLNEACAGGFSGFGIGPKGLELLTAHKGETVNKRFCGIESGQRYFHNSRATRVHKAIEEEEDLATKDFDKQMSHHLLSGNSSLPGPFGINYPPYTNSCMNVESKAEGAFPLNYPGAHGGVSSCGRQAALGDASRCEKKAYRSECYDVTGQLPPATFQRECIGTNLIWTKGYGKKALSNYICEYYNPDGSFKYGGPVCAGHREGELIKSVTLFKSTNYKIKKTKQCQFDNDLGRYDWHLVSHKGERTAQGSNFYVERAITPPNGQATFAPPPHKTTCSWEGNEYPLGTKMTQTNKKTGSFPDLLDGTHTYICVQSAPAPALPRFAHVNSKVSPVPQTTLRTDMYSVTFEPPQESTQTSPGCEDIARPAGKPAEFCVVTKQGVNTNRNCFEYASVFGGAFPGNFSAISFFLNKNEWASMKFDVAGMSWTRGAWAREIPQIAPTTTGPRIMTISRCPGNFDRDLVGPNCYFKSTDNEMLWKRKGDFPNVPACELDPSVPHYYFNIIYTDQPAGTPTEELKWDCASSSTASACSDSLTPSYE